MDCALPLQARTAELLLLPAVQTAMRGAGGHATAKAIGAAASSSGHGNTVAGNRMLYAAQRKYRKADRALYEQHMAHLPQHCAELVAANPGSHVNVETDASGKFKRMFFMFKPVADAIMLAGRMVSGADMAHLKFELISGVMAAGVFKFGSGNEIPVWQAYFASPESGDNWECCGQMVCEAGCSCLYDGRADIADRDKGHPRFEACFERLHAINCSGHILDNVRKVNRESKEPPFHNDQFWRLQGSRSKAEALTNFKAFNDKPKTKKYLMEIPAGKWVHYAQVQGGATTYRERSSNMAEREMAVEAAARSGLRAMGPLQYIAGGSCTMFSKLAKEAGLHASWHSAEAVRVPHAVQVLFDFDQVANAITVSLAGPECYKVSIVDGTRGLNEGVVDWVGKTCSRCLKWQDEHLPCSDAIAVGRMKGLSAVAVFEYGASDCYKVQKSALEACTATFVPLPPSAYFEAMKLGGDVAATDAAFLSASDGTAGADPSEIVPAGLPEGGVPPPDTKVAKRHGNSKANRHKQKSDSGYRGRGGGGSGTRQRTKQAATLTAALRTSKLAQMHCSKCTKAGRIGMEYDGHKAPQCPHDTAAVEARASVTIILSSSSGDDAGGASSSSGDEPIDVSGDADVSPETGGHLPAPPHRGQKRLALGAPRYVASNSSQLAARATYARKAAFAAAPLGSDDDDDAPLATLASFSASNVAGKRARRGENSRRP